MGNIHVKVKKYNEGMEGPEMVEAPEKIRTALEMLAREKVLKDDAKLIREGALDAITEFHFTTGARDFSVPGVGSCVAYLGSGKRFDKAKMGMFLVEHGVPSTLVSEAMEHATVASVNERVTVRFTPEK